MYYKELLKSVFVTFEGPFKLVQTYESNRIPEKPGVYCLIYEDKIMKFGKADNLKRRMGDYCGYKEDYITAQNVGEVKVMWKVTLKEKNRLLEKRLSNHAKFMGEKLPWSQRC